MERPALERVQGGLQGAPIIIGVRDYNLFKACNPNRDCLGVLTLLFSPMLCRKGSKLLGSV